MSIDFVISKNAEAVWSFEHISSWEKHHIVGFSWERSTNMQGSQRLSAHNPYIFSMQTFSLLFYLFLLIFSSCDPLPSHLPLHLRCLIGSCGFRMDFVTFRWRKCCFEQPLQNLLFQEGIRRERRDKRPSNRMTFVISDGPFLSGLGKIPNILQNRTI